MAEPLRVFHLIKGLGLGGAEQLLLTAARHPDSVTYGFGYFLPHKDALAAPLRATGSEVVCFPARSAVGIACRVPRLARFLRRWRPDVLHCHLPLSGIAGRLAGAIARVQVVYTEHNLMERYHPLTRRANLVTWRLQTAVIAVSSPVARSIAAHASAQVPVRVIPNGVPVESLVRQPEAGLRVRRQLGIRDSALVVGQVAVFRQQKRLDLWIQVAADLVARRPETRFLLVGDGPLRPRVEEWIAERGLTSAIHLPGLQADVGPYLSAMDLLLVSSEFEGLPLATLEAMSHELPVVATAVGGLPDVVVDGVTGRLAASGDRHGLGEAVAQLAADPALARAMGRAGRRRVEEEFSTGLMLRRTEQLYRELVAQ